MKQIEIEGKTFDIDCNAFTRFQYKSIFKRGIFEDIKVLNDYSNKQEDLRKQMKAENKTDEEIERELGSAMMTELDSFLDVIEKIAYILIYTANNKVGNFEEWLKSIKKIDLNEKWISEVTEFAVNSFC